MRLFFHQNFFSSIFFFIKIFFQQNLFFIKIFFSSASPAFPSSPKLVMKKICSCCVEGSSQACKIQAGAQGESGSKGDAAT